MVKQAESGQTSLTVRRFGLDGGSFDRNGGQTKWSNGPSRSNQMVKGAVAVKPNGQMGRHGQTKWSKEPETRGFNARAAWVAIGWYRCMRMRTCLSLHTDVEMLSVHRCRNAL